MIGAFAVLIFLFVVKTMHSVEAMPIELVNGQPKHFNCPPVPFKPLTEAASKAAKGWIHHDLKTVAEGKWHQQEAGPDVNKHCFELWDKCTQSIKLPQCKHGKGATGTTLEEKQLKVITGQLLELSNHENLEESCKMPVSEDKTGKSTKENDENKASKSEEDGSGEQQSIDMKHLETVQSTTRPALKD